MADSVHIRITRDRPADRAPDDDGARPLRLFVARLGATAEGDEGGETITARTAARSDTSDSQEIAGKHGGGTSQQRLAAFCEAMASLPPTCRRVFEMRTVYGWSHQEIADSLGISTQTVETHLATGFARCMVFMRRRDDGGTGKPFEAAGPARKRPRAGVR